MSDYATTECIYCGDPGAHAGTRKCVNHDACWHRQDRKALLEQLQIEKDRANLWKSRALAAGWKPVAPKSEPE